jgi:hypothetical protein
MNIESSMSVGNNNIFKNKKLQQYTTSGKNSMNKSINQNTRIINFVNVSASNESTHKNFDPNHLPEIKNNQSILKKY